MTEIGRYCKINGEKEVKDLIAGSDFREPKFRREVFLRFYEFHLKYNAHAGAVYYVFPYLFKRFNFTVEQKLWFTFINGCSQNVITTWLIYEQFPDIQNLDIKKLRKFFRKNYTKLGWDTDRRYHKNVFEDCVESYIKNLDGMSQEAFFNKYTPSKDKFENFQPLWDVIRNNFHSFGRLSTFSYMEYLRISGINVDCDDLLFEDISGSKSHRNGLCKVLGRDDLEWFKEPHKYTPEVINWLKGEADELFKEAKERIDHPDVSLFTLETTLCCYKGWHRKNRRYPNVYNDMFFDRIVYAIKQWGDIGKFDVFWECRDASLPKHLLKEAKKPVYGMDKVKQNHYRLTGEVIMMDREHSCFSNKWNNYDKQ
jgi:hypothetical protein